MNDLDRLSRADLQKAAEGLADELLKLNERHHGLRRALAALDAEMRATAREWGGTDQSTTEHWADRIVAILKDHSAS